MLFVFPFWLISLSMIISSCIHVTAYKMQRVCQAWFQVLCLFTLSLILIQSCEAVRFELQNPLPLEGKTSTHISCDSCSFLCLLLPLTWPLSSLVQPSCEIQFVFSSYTHTHAHSPPGLFTKSLWIVCKFGNHGDGATLWTIINSFPPPHPRPFQFLLPSPAETPWEPQISIILF